MSLVIIVRNLETKYIFSIAGHLIFWDAKDSNGHVIEISTINIHCVSTSNISELLGNKCPSSRTSLVCNDACCVFFFFEIQEPRISCRKLITQTVVYRVGNSNLQKAEGITPH